MSQLAVAGAATIVVAVVGSVCLPDLKVVEVAVTYQPAVDPVEAPTSIASAAVTVWFTPLRAVDANVTVTPGGSYTHAQVIYLQQANNDVTATSGITFGGAAMDSNGNWTGSYGPPQTLTGSTFTFTLPHTQAAIVHFY